MLWYFAPFIVVLRCDHTHTNKHTHREIRKGREREGAKGEEEREEI